jgi:hypothetical protein
MNLVKKLSWPCKPKKDGAYRQVLLVSNMKIVSVSPQQFIQCVEDWIKSRLCSDSNSGNVQLLQDISVLNLSTVSTENVCHGESEIRRTSRRFLLDEIPAI